MKIEITINHLNSMIENLIKEKEFNKVEFLIWYLSVNPNFDKKFEELKDIENIKKIFNNNVLDPTVFKPIQINNKEDYYKFILYSRHGTYLNSLNKMLSENLSIDYWKEVLTIILQENESKIVKNNKPESLYQVIMYSFKNKNFLQDNISEIKEGIIEFFNLKNFKRSTKVNEMFNILLNAIDEKEIFSNDFLTFYINETIKMMKEGSSLGKVAILEKISKKINTLDFSNVDKCEELELIIEGKEPIKKIVNSNLYYYKVDLPLYAFRNKYHFKSLEMNFLNGLNEFKNLMEKSFLPEEIVIKKTNNLVTMTIIHENELINKITDDLIKAIEDYTVAKKQLTGDDIKNIIEFNVLNNSIFLKNKDGVSNKNKI